jgi:diguanylate cyclase (GGDEF)-like protein/PAS domain S-box-containing protein
MTSRDTDPAPEPSPADWVPSLQQVLLESRERWRDFTTLSVDLAFETDSWGRLVFIHPETVFGWPASTLLGQNADLLLAGDAKGSGFNPFRANAASRGRRAWLRRPDGTPVCIGFSVAPMQDEAGQILGVRGVGHDITQADGQDAAVAAKLRRGEVVEHVLERMREEVLAPRMMQASLHALCTAMGAEGCAVVETGPDGTISPAQIIHSTIAMPDSVRGAIGGAQATPIQRIADDEREVLGATCQPRFGQTAMLTVWRQPDARPFDDDDRGVVAAAAAIIRMVLEHASIQQEMSRQARTDPLTGLLNRRAFIEEIGRRLDRLDHEALPGTLMFADLDNFKLVNDRYGHEIGDEALCGIATLLRATVRPTDLVARLGGDEFALWLDGADELTAAERAESLRLNGPAMLADVVGATNAGLGLSIGIATRAAGFGETIEALLHRADQAMYAVKRGGRGQWMVSHGGPGYRVQPGANA